MAEKGTYLCRVRGEGGIFLGFRKDILTENLTDRDNTFLSCTRCQGILREVCMSSSGEQFCSCCTKGEEQTHSNIHVRNTVLSLKCSCPLYQRGCEWLGTLGECENHLDVCCHVHEKCKLGCKIVLPRHEHKIHVSEMCLFREIPCEHCKGDFKVCDMPNHLSKCDKMPLTCELKCGTVVCREDMARHLDKDCGRVLEKCKLGCEIVLPRDELNNHVNEKCVQRMIPCEHCKRDFKVCDMSNHLEECPKMPLTCELECGILVCREDMVQHLEEECVEKKVECPFIKYKCEVGLVKRKELNQHLEEKRTEHTELKLSAMEEIVFNQNEVIDKQSKQTDSLEAKVKQLTQKFEVLETEAVNLRETLYSLTNVTKLHWRINDIIIETNILAFQSEESCYAGDYYCKFQLHSSSGNIQIVINACPRRDQLPTHILKYPLAGSMAYSQTKIFFLTRLICHSNPKAAKEYRSELIEIKSVKYLDYSCRKIATIPTSDITAEFIKDGGIELEILIILK